MTLKGINFSKQVEVRINNALRAWHAPVSDDNNLLNDLLIAQAFQDTTSTDMSGSQDRSVTNQILEAGIQELETQDAEIAQVLRLRFVEKEKLWAVANNLGISAQTVSRLQRKGIRLLTLNILHQENEKRENVIQTVEAELPPSTYTRLFGVQETCQTVHRLLMDKTAPAVLAIVGLGGIGKTAITDRLIRDLIPTFHFHNILWIRIQYQTLSGKNIDPSVTFEYLLTELAKKLWSDQAETFSPQQRLVNIRKALKNDPYLVVIDNLESQRDADYILNQLHGLTRPTKFILTSRSPLAEQASVYNFYLQELSLHDSVAFVRYHAQECGIHTLANASDGDLISIYQTSGGNPFALKLVVSLLNVLPLSEVLSDLTSHRTVSIEGMYKHIYRQAWKALSENGRFLLQAMSLVSEEGGTVNYLGEISGLSKDILLPALHELFSRSLIEVRGSINEKRYGIHRLTNSFISSEIIDLPEW
ncbi:MAG: NB-ARC domain-containing protein [Chloroflexota bacterium]